MTQNDQRALKISKNIQTELQPYHEKLDESAKISSELHRRYMYWFASASFSGPLLSVEVEFCWFASAQL